MSTRRVLMFVALVCFSGACTTLPSLDPFRETSTTDDTQSKDTGSGSETIDTGSGSETIDTGSGSETIDTGSDTATTDVPIGVEWSTIPAGSFWMGTPDGSCPADYPGGADCASELGRYSDEGLHYVTLTQDFELMRTEVTQAQFAALMSYTSSRFGPCSTCPVETVSWNEALAFANALSVQAGYGACYDCTGTGPDLTCDLKAAYAKPQDCPGYRLPTESEWEYAARAGSLTAFYNGAITNIGCSPLDPNLDAIAWYCGNASGTTHPVAGKKANAWGVYDMSGNVWEWTWDWYQFGYPAGTTSAPVMDPVGPETGSTRVVRGGLFYDSATSARCGNRYRNFPAVPNGGLGFRLARSVP